MRRSYKDHTVGVVWLMVNANSTFANVDGPVPDVTNVPKFALPCVLSSCGAPD